MPMIQDRPLDEVTQMMGHSEPGSIVHTEASAELQRRQFLNAQRSTTIAILAAAASAISAVTALVTLIYAVSKH